MKKLILLSTLVIITLLAGCSNAFGKEENEVVKIGVTGADGLYWDIIAEKAKEKGIEIELVEFSDYIQPNNALANGEIDMNSFQHLAFLSQFNIENNLNNVPVGSTVIAPLGLYSEKYQSLDDIPDGADIAIPNDPANTGRGLKVLQAAGLLVLKDDVGLYGTPEDIVENPKNLQFVEVVAQQTPRVLPDVAISIINSGIAGQAGLYLDDALFYDDPHSDEARPYINVFAVRSEDADNETYREIAKLYQKEEVAAAVREDSNGGNVVVDIPVENLQETLDQLEQDIETEIN